MGDANLLHQQGLAAVRANDYATAQQLLTEAREATADRDILDRIDVTSAYVETETGNAAAALALVESVLARSGTATLTAGLANAQLAVLVMRNGEMERAAEHFEVAIAGLKGAPEHLAGAHLNRGNLHLHLGDPERAAADFSEAAAQYELAGDDVERAKAMFNLGYTQLLRNDLIAATRGMDAASEVLTGVSRINAAIVQQDRAEVLLASGRPREAAAALEAAGTAYGGEKLSRFQAECELLLARTLLSEDSARARTLARTAARRFTRHGSDSWAHRAEAVAITADVECGTATKALRARSDELIGLLRNEGFRQDAERLALYAARLAVRRKDLADASARLARIRITADSPITTRLLTREVRAELAEAQSRPTRMRACAKQGLEELHAWQATFGSLDLQSSTVGHGQHLARLGLRSAMQDGSPAVVFEWSERARALASRVTSLRPPPDPALAADLTALRVADPKDLAAVRALRERIRSHSWFSASGTIAEPVTLAALQERLARDDAALVAHIVLDGQLTALAVTATGTDVVPLGEAAPVRAILDRVAADLDFAAQNRSGDIAAAVRGSLRTDLSTLADALVRPLLGTIGYRRLVLTPSALLAGTPWTCLPGLIGRPLTVPTSASRWVEQTSAPAARVAIAGFVAGPRLARAEEEVRRSAAAWPTAQVLVGDEADAARAGWLASRVDLFHVAGHGQHPGDHPLFSAIELADGPWFGHDIDLLPRTPEVVVLSACDLGRSTVLHGEESVGMSAAWLHAGARTVISSPALLADELACEVLAAWHLKVAAGAAPADALAQVGAEIDDVVPLLSFGAGW